MDTQVPHGGPEEKNCLGLIRQQTLGGSGGSVEGFG